MPRPTIALRALRWVAVFAALLAAPRAPSQGAVETIDLLARANMRRHGYYSQFAKRDGAIHTPPAQRNARLRLPATIPPEYELLFEVTRRRGKGSFRVGLVCGGRQCLVVLDGNEGAVDGLNLVDGKAFANNETTREHPTGPLLRRGTSTTVVCQVRPDGVTVTVAGTTAVQWTGDPARLSLKRTWSVPPRPQLFVGSENAGFEISRIVLRGRGVTKPLVQDVGAAQPRRKPGAGKKPQFKHLPPEQRPVAICVAEVTGAMRASEHTGCLLPDSVLQLPNALPEPWRERVSRFAELMAAGRFVGAERYRKKLGELARQEKSGALWKAISPPMQRVTRETSSLYGHRISELVTGLLKAVRKGDRKQVLGLLQSARDKHERPDPVIDVIEEYLRVHWRYRDDARVSISLGSLMVGDRVWREVALTNTANAYANFLGKHPHSAYRHPATKRFVALTLGGKHSKLPGATTHGFVRGRGYAVLNIHNDTSHRLTICYDGPETFAVIFKPDEKASLSLRNGQYQIAGRVNSANIRPYAGTETYRNDNQEVRFYITGGTYMGIPALPAIPTFTVGPRKRFKTWTPTKRRATGVAAPGTTADDYWFILGPATSTVVLGTARTGKPVARPLPLHPYEWQPIAVDTLALNLGKTVLRQASKDLGRRVPPGHALAKITIDIENAGPTDVRLNPAQFRLTTSDMGSKSKTRRPIGIYTKASDASSLRWLEENPTIRLRARSKTIIALVCVVPTSVYSYVGKVSFLPAAVFAAERRK